MLNPRTDVLNTKRTTLKSKSGKFTMTLMSFYERLFMSIKSIFELEVHRHLEILFTKLKLKLHSDQRALLKLSEPIRFS